MVYPHSYRQKNSETITTSCEYGAYFAHNIETKIKIQPELLKILQWIDQYRPQIKSALAEFVEIRSISSDSQYFGECNRMIKLTEQWLKKLNIKYEVFNVGKFECDGKTHTIPCSIIAHMGNDPKKYTICVYCQMDIKNPLEQEGWKTNPFKMECIDKVFYGAGIATSKAPLMMWMNVVQAFQHCHMDLPVNLKFLFQSMHENRNLGLESFLRTQAIGTMKNVNYICMHDSAWLGPNLPCLSYGSVGYMHIWISSEKIEGSSTDPLSDLNEIRSKLVNDKGDMKIPVFRYVAQVTPDEETNYERIQDFDIREIREKLLPHQKNWSKMRLLMHFWRFCTCQLGPILECTCEKKNSTPKKLKFHLFVKIVPNQIPERFLSVLKESVENFVTELKIENKVEVKQTYGSRPWVEDITSAHYEAARRATIQIYKEEPSVIREDRDLPTLLIFNKIFKKNILLLPLGNSTTNAREANENISERCFFEGTKLLAAYLFQVSYIEKLE